MTINDATCVAIDHLQDIMHKRPSGNPCADCAHDRGEACAASRIPYHCKTRGRPDERAEAALAHADDARRDAMAEKVRDAQEMLAEMQTDDDGPLPVPGLPPMDREEAAEAEYRNEEAAGG